MGRIVTSFFLIVSVHLLAPFAADSVYANSYSTAFALSQNPVSEGGNWINGLATGLQWSDIVVDGNGARGTQNGDAPPPYNDSIAVLTGTWGADQQAQATVRTVNQPAGNVFEELEILLRFKISPNSARGYEINFSTDQHYAEVVRWNGPQNSFTLLDSRSIDTLHTGDIVRATIAGTNSPTISVYVNGTLKYSVVDSGPAWTDGNPGMGFFYQTDGSGGAVTDYGFTNYLAIDITNDVTPPVISGVTASAMAGGAATIKWTTNEASDSLVAYGTTPAYGLRTSLDPSLVTAHTVVLPAPAGYQSTFSGVENPLSEAAAWTSPVGGWGAVRKNTGAQATGTSTWSAARLQSPAITADQYAQVTYAHALAAVDGAGVTLRMTAAENGSGYLIFEFNGNVDAYTVAYTGSLNYTLLTSVPITPAAGTNTLRAEIQGSTIHVFYNAALVITWTDTTYTTGQPGIALFNGGGNPAIASIDLGTLGTLGALGGISPVYHYSVMSRDASGNLAVSPDALFTTMDVPPPVISGVTVSAITANSATINWTTDKAADSQVAYGTTPSYGSTSALNATLATAHTVVLSGLSSNASYHYAVMSRDASGNLEVSPDALFTTMNVPPVISGVTVSAITANSATISWTTDKAADSQVAYGTTPSYGSTSALNTTMVTAHTVVLSGLSSHASYHYAVMSKDPSGNLAASADAVFTTLNVPPPVISGVTVSAITANSATINWTTDKAADSQVAYGTTPSYGSTSALNATMVTAHTVVLSGLPGGTAPAAGYQSTFRGAENPLSEAGAWTSPVGGWGAVRKNTGALATGISTWSAARLQSPAITADQYAQVTYAGVLAAADGAGVTLRMTSAVNGSGYLIFEFNGNVDAYTVAYTGSLDYTLLTSVPVTPAAGTNTLRAEIQGSTIRVFYNAALIITWTDTTYTTGQPGIALFNSGGDPTIASVDLGALGAPGGIPAVYHYSVMSRDASGNLAASADAVFTTLNVPPPVISGVTVSAITANSATINWTTDKASDSQVAYGTTPNYGSTSALNATLVTAHTVVLSGLPGGTAPAAGYQSTFRGAENPLSEAGAWTSPVGGWGAVRKNTGALATGISTWSAARLQSPAITADQYAQVTYAGVLAAADGAGVTLRMTSAVNGSGYLIFEFNGNVDAYTVAYTGSLDYTLLTSVPVTPAAGTNTLRAEIQGSTIRIFYNAVLIITWTDTTYTTGQPGIALFNSGGDPAIASVDLGALGAPGGIPAVYHYSVMSRDASGNLAVSPDAVFTTLNVQPPAISGVTVSAIATGTPTLAAGSPGSPLISPRSVTLTFTRTQQFTSNLNSVTWSVDGLAGGSADIGTITNTGLYTPADSIGTHTVTVSDGTQSASATVYISNYAGVYTHHNDSFRSGLNTNEIALTPGNVNQSQFGRLYSYQLDGLAFASPLYAANVNIPGAGFHNVVYIATEHDSVYAFDADGLASAPLWKVSFLGPDINPMLPLGNDIPNEIGITSTPVIDAASGTIYVVAGTQENSNSVMRLHALDMTTGAEKFGGPVALQAIVPGTGSGAVGTHLAFDPFQENQRSALLLSGGVVYIAFGAHTDISPWHGWILGYTATTLTQVLVYNSTPNGNGGGIWQSGGGLATDGEGNIYFGTGNGTFDIDSGGIDYGDTAVKLSPAGAVADYFTPYDQQVRDINDYDLGSSGPLLLVDQTSGPNPHLLIFADKSETIFVLNRDDMGHYNSTGNNQIVQSFNGGIQSRGPTRGNFGAPVYFNGYVYFGAATDTVKAFQLSSGLLSTAPASQSAEVFGGHGASLSVSANVNANGILWALESNGAPGVLSAYDATNLANKLYDSNQAGSRDALMDGVVRYTVPVVANGKAFVVSQSKLNVYGLLP